MDTGYHSDARRNIAVNQVNYASLHCIFQCIPMNGISRFMRKLPKTFSIREVIMHARPSSGTMRLNFGPFVRPNVACISRLLHIVENIICLC